MENDAKVFSLIKMGTRKYMENLFYKGEIYMNTIDFYKNNENSEIGDIYEGVDLIRDGIIVNYKDNLDKQKLYCMWHINNVTPCETANCYHDLDSGKVIQDINLNVYRNFGGSAVIIQNVKEFYRRIDLELSKLGLLQKNQIVTYYDEKTLQEKKISPFMKRKKYNHQNEIRFLVNSGKSEPLIINIGSLDKIGHFIEDVNCQLSYTRDYK